MQINNQYTRKQGDKYVTYYDADLYDVERDFDVVIEGLTVESSADKLNKSAEKGRVGRPIRAAVIGIPNSGKSSFINKLAGKNIAVVGNKPGVTRAKQWIKTNYNVELMDTPGILWPKLEQEEVALHLAYLGSNNRVLQLVIDLIGNDI